MYEFKNLDGELVTVRSLRTLERLIADAAIRSDTPFRGSGETTFLPAAAHPLVGRIAAETGVPLRASSANHPAEERTRRVASKAPSPELTPQPVASPLAAEVDPAWTARQLAREPDATSRWRLPVQAPPAKLRAPSRMLHSSRKAFLVALAWQGAALLAGLLAYGLGSSSLNAVVNGLISLVAVGIAARAGGHRLRREHPTSSAAPVWAATATFVCLLALAGGAGGFFFAMIAAAGLALGWRKSANGRA
ncbi:hypothetical protein [Roseomonas harenae]|uniref:hypothetical protein n=1 Tax=Muricoccus harenae TaxID=2692566 RepID=UPI001331BFA1|nr:hypothetical protein [Roseomonas harenae]